MQFTRWRRYGKDRLYVRDDVGADIGWWDLATNEGHPQEPGAALLLADAVRRWQSEHPTSSMKTAERADLRPDGGVGLEHQPPAAPDLSTPATTAGTPAPPVQVSRDQQAVTDLIHRPPGDELMLMVQTAHAVGDRPTFWRRLVLGKNAYSTWERGLIGERLVWAELKKLEAAAGWGFLNSIPIGSNGSDIDHLVVGPAGVFSVNTKHHVGARIWVGGDTFLVNGHRQPYVRNSRFEARRAGGLLSRASGIPVTVQGMVVPVNARDVTVKVPPRDVHVVNRKRLVKYLLALPPVLPPPVISAVFSAARTSSTWQT